MLTWLEDDLRATRKFWKVVFFHHPGYATGIHQDEPEAAQVRQFIVPILERYGVQIVFNGHEHTYQRTSPMLAGQVAGEGADGIVYVTSGGGGQVTHDTASAGWIAKSSGVNHYVRSEISGAAMTVAAVAADGSQIDSVRLAPRPTITGQIVEAAGFSANLASGGVATIFGRNLCVTEARPAPSASQAAGSSVTVQGIRVPILYADANQINVQFPFTFSGTGTLEVLTPNGASRIAANVAPVAPAVFLAPGAQGFALAEHADGTLVSQDSPARSGEVITLILTGLGAVRGAVDPGVPPASPLTVAVAVRVQVGGAEAEVLGAALGSTLPGVYEVRMRIPPGISPAPSLQVTAGGVQSNPALLAVA
jgi:uncharacterized protein (TIGR03437 family)